MNGGYGVLERIVRIGIVLVVVYLVLAVLVLLLASQDGKMLSSSRYLGYIIEHALIYAAVAAGMGLVMAAGEADFSIGGTTTLAAIVAASLMAKYDVPAPAALVLILGLGLLIGLVNGLLIAGLRLPFYLVTPAMWGLTLGLGWILVTARGLLLGGLPFEWSWLLLLLLNLVVYGLGVVALLLLGHFTSLGKLTGLNARSEAEGWPGSLALGLYKIGAYTASGLLAAVAGLALVNLTRLVTPGIYYSDLTVMAIAAAVIGGVPLWKGSTRLLGAFLGSVALALITEVIRALTASKLVDDRLASPTFVWIVLALATVILWGLAGWVLDLVFGRRKGTQFGDTAQHVTGGNR